MEVADHPILARRRVGLLLSGGDPLSESVHLTKPRPFCSQASRGLVADRAIPARPALAPVTNF